MNRNRLSAILFIIFGTLLLPNPLNAVAVKAPMLLKNVVYGLTTEEVIKLDKQALEEKTGRRLKFKEKIALKLTQKILRKNPKKTPVQAFDEVKTKGFAIGSFIFGLGSLAIWGIIFGTVGVVLGSIAISRIRQGKGERKLAILAVLGIFFGLSGVVGWSIGQFIIAGN